MGYPNNRDDRRSSMHKATCSDCGKGCQVPFKPTSNKPVFCSDCFEEQGGGRGRDDRRGGGRFNERRGGRGRDDRRGGGREFKQSFRATCDGCQQSCEVPFKPSNGKPIYCDSCFGKDNKKQVAPKQDFEVERKLKELMKKVDLIMKALDIEMPKQVITTIELPKPKKEKDTEAKEEKNETEKETEEPKKMKAATPKKALKKTSTKKAPAKKKAAPKKTTAKKTTTKTAEKKEPAKKKTTAKKAAVKKAPAKKAAVKKTSKK